MHPADARLTRPGGLAERLFRMRKSAGLTGDTLAAELGWGEKTGRTKVSKIENGKQVPSADDIRNKLTICSTCWPMCRLCIPGGAGDCGTARRQSRKTSAGAPRRRSASATPRWL